MGSKNRHYERGASMVETAVVLSVFLMVLFGVVEFGRAIYTYHMVANAARLGTRFAIVRGSACVHTGSPDPWPCGADTTEVSNYVQQQSINLGAGSITVNATWPGGNTGCTSSASPYNGPGCVVKVQVTYPFQFLVPLVSKATLSMSSTSQMVISQ